MIFGRIMLFFWSGVCQSRRNWFGVNQAGVIWVGVIGLNMNFRVFAPNLFNFKIILAPRVFEKAVAPSVFTYCFTIPWRALVGDIQYPCDGFEDVESALTSTIWAVAYNGYRWVHTDTVITTPSDSYHSNFSTTIYNAKGDVLITTSLSV